MNENKPKFTPGPWKVHLDKRNGSACSIIEDKTGDCVARTVYRFHRGGERNANGNLIASAPEMYAELQDLLDAMEAGLFPQAAPGVDYPAVMEKKFELRKVLKKARGEK